MADPQAVSKADLSVDETVGLKAAQLVVWMAGNWVESLAEHLAGMWVGQLVDMLGNQLAGMKAEM
jgi:hypothetical protein